MKKIIDLFGKYKHYFESNYFYFQPDESYSGSEKVYDL